jgi:hypothetical protein
VWTARLIAVAAVVTGTVTGFLWQPPFSAGDTSGLINAGRYVVAIMVGLLAYPMLLYRNPANVTRWSLVTLTCLALGTFSLFTYYERDVAWVRTYKLGSQDLRYVVAGHLTPQASVVRTTAAKRGDFLTDEKLLSMFPDTFPQNVYRVWDRREIADHELVLAVLYLSTLLLLSAAVITVSQCYRCTASNA